MSNEFNQKCTSLLAELNLGSPENIKEIKPLAGGVSSDIAAVKIGEHQYCVKFALPKLKVTADWQVPVHRNRAEYEWLQFAASIAPKSAVRLHGRSDKLHGFVMDYIDGDSVYLWKTALLSAQENQDEAGQVGQLMGEIHKRSTKSSFNAASFQNQDDFYSIRIEPYLVFTASKHPGLAKPLSNLAKNLHNSNQVLVHGDISPKNILFRDGIPIILDAECATMGDASFDVAFCLNHLILKAIHLPGSTQQLLESVLQLWQAYQSSIDWEQADKLEARVCQLLPALMLARIDGKSPVEYLNSDKQALVREIAIALIEAPCYSLHNFTNNVQSKLTA